ncbi:MAG: argininosuccinate lyase [Methanomassiliicoccales archaeon]|nr:argininosuccinate lyase [Methanomassiliicoccales archaeon]
MHMAEKQLWSGRFAEGPSQMTLSFTSSLSVDMKLAWYDIAGSMAHAKMLGAKDIVSLKEMETIVDGLGKMLAELENGELDLSEDLEDIHTNVESLLTDRVGEAGKRLHTARSRNDQVSTDFRMFVRDAILETVALLIDVQGILIDRAAEETSTMMPGFTHLQHAQPVSLGFHLMAHVFRLQRDTERFLDAYKRVNQCPLGAGALAGTGHPIDREMTSAALGFDRPTDNAMDTVSDRDFALEFAYVCAQTMVHLSSMGEELVLWTSPEFGFAEMSDAFATGSSIMPQKKNPDVAELVRGRSSIAVGNLVQLLTLMKGLPLSYNRDMQEDKGAVFSSYETLTSCLYVIGPMYHALTFDRKRMADACVNGFLNATDLADHLVQRGMPFRQAHGVVGSAVQHCVKQGKTLDSLSVEDLKKFSELLDRSSLDHIKLEACLGRRSSLGGTSPKQVEAQVKTAALRMDAYRAECYGEIDRLEGVWAELRK